MTEIDNFDQILLYRLVDCCYIIIRLSSEYTFTYATIVGPTVWTYSTFMYVFM